MKLIIIGIVSLLVVQIKTEECTTPNNEKAQCILLYECPVLIGALATQQKKSIDFLRQSNCGGTAINPMVCCGSSSTFLIENKPPAVNASTGNVTEKINLLPSRRFCGLQHSDDYQTLTNSNDPSITEFPWLAALIFKRDNESRPDCGGSLINNRYVLTVAHCVVTDLHVLVEVHLGEYNVRNKTDCIKEPPFDEECSTPIEVFGVEKIIPFPGFTTRKKDHDIALVRLNRTVTYSDYIRPICLPLPDTILAKVGDVLISSGWGLTSFAGERAEVKKKVYSTLIENQQCADMYNRSLRQNVITRNHLCTIPTNSSSSTECQGDSGGPLLFAHRYQWHQEGVISFSLSCDTSFPRAYTKVVNYMDWILENIEK